jgi:chromate reductase, NAD(P)H dehydrogenase (quinone)
MNSSVQTGRTNRGAVVVKILAMSGSLQASSSNTALLRTARSIAPDGVDVEVYEGLADIPPFNPDLDVEPALGPVTDLRAKIQEADGVLFASPEYAHGMPGSLKNALDWVVGSGELYGKPVAVLCASPRESGGLYGREALERTLKAQGASVVASSTVQTRRRDRDDGQPPEPETIRTLTTVLRALVAHRVA